jgi:hypothetical protein
MFILTINEPHWHEPIISPVHGVTITIEHTRRVSRHGDYLDTARWLNIIHPDRETERFRLCASATYEVTLDPNYVPISV